MSIGIAERRDDLQKAHGAACGAGSDANLDGLLAVNVETLPDERRVHLLGRANAFGGGLPAADESDSRGQGNVELSIADLTTRVDDRDLELRVNTRGDSSSLVLELHLHRAGGRTFVCYGMD